MNDSTIECVCGRAQTCDGAGDCATDTRDTTQTYNFNADPEWQRFCLSLDPLIWKIAVKYCATDEDLRNDVAQEARIGLATIRPEDIAGFEQYATGTLSAAQWDKALLRYCGNVIRNSILSYLESYVKGNWYQGRTRHVKDKATGQTRKVRLPARFSSLDDLTERCGMQVDEHGAISWPTTHAVIEDQRNVGHLRMDLDETAE